jgi:hypothetical protein
MIGLYDKVIKTGHIGEFKGFKIYKPGEPLFMPKYRIVRKSWRSNHDAVIRHEYLVERFVRNSFFGFSLKSWSWKPCRHEGGSFGESWTVDASFSELREAYDFMNNLQARIPADKVLKQI